MGAVERWSPVLWLKIQVLERCISVFKQSLPHPAGVSASFAAPGYSRARLFLWGGADEVVSAPLSPRGSPAEGPARQALLTRGLIPLLAEGSARATGPGTFLFSPPMLLPRLFSTVVPAWKLAVFVRSSLSSRGWRAFGQLARNDTFSLVQTRTPPTKL